MGETESGDGETYSADEIEGYWWGGEFYPTTAAPPPVWVAGSFHADADGRVLPGGGPG